MEIGDRLKEIRNSKGYSLRDLSELTGFSIGFLSNVERELTSPTISSLEKICTSLGVSLAEVILENREGSQGVVVRASDRMEIFRSPRSGIRWELLLSDIRNQTQLLCLILRPGGAYKNSASGHEGYEYGVVTKGAVQLQIGEDRYFLKQGDGFYIAEGVPHFYNNCNPEDAEIIIFLFGKPVNLG